MRRGKARGTGRGCNSSSRGLLDKTKGNGKGKGKGIGCMYHLTTFVAEVRHVSACRWH